MRPRRGEHRCVAIGVKTENTICPDAFVRKSQIGIAVNDREFDTAANIFRDILQGHREQIQFIVEHLGLQQTALLKITQPLDRRAANERDNRTGARRFREDHGTAARIAHTGNDIIGWQQLVPDIHL